MLQKWKKLFMCTSTVQTIVQCLGYPKVCIKWSPEYVQGITSIWKYWWNICNTTSQTAICICDRLAGNEMWCHHIQLTLKTVSMQWKQPSSPSPKKFKSQPSVRKIMLFSLIPMKCWFWHTRILTSPWRQSTTLEPSKDLHIFIEKSMLIFSQAVSSCCTMPIPTWPALSRPRCVPHAGTSSNQSGFKTMWFPRIQLPQERVVHLDQTKISRPQCFSGGAAARQFFAEGSH